MPSQMLETLLSALNAIQAMPFECPASMKAEVSKVLGDLPSAAKGRYMDHAKTVCAMNWISFSKGSTGIATVELK